MKIGKILAIAIVFILLIPSISSVASSQGGNSNDSSGESLIHALLRIRFRLGYLPSLKGLGPYCIFQPRPPTPIQAFPASISLTYITQTTFEIGGKNPFNTSEWQSMVGVAQGWSWAWMDKQIIYEFVPDNVSKIWNVQFNPNKLILTPNRNDLNWPGAETPFKTNVTISLNPTADLSVVPKDTILKINIVKTEILDKMGILKGNPPFARTHKDEYIQKCEQTGEQTWFAPGGFYSLWNNIIGKYLLFLINTQFPNVDTHVDSTVEVLVKVDNYHLATIAPPKPMEIQPYEVKSIPVTIKNIGSHIDSYNFRVNCSDENMIVIPPPAITLKPGEESQVLVGVAAPKTFVSVGSTASIYVEAYSVDDPESVFSNTITLTTSGVYVTGASTYYTVFIVIALLIIVALFLYFLRRNREKICKKPEKPWKIPEEKEYLGKLKEKNKEEYKKVLEMMKQEYESSLLWYTSYVKAMMEKERREKQKAKVAKKEKKVAEKPKTKKIEEKKPIETKEEKIEKTSEKPAEKIELESLEERRKQEAILRIKYEQEKQKKKFKP